MRITILVNYDLASALALSYLLPQLTQHQVSIFHTEKNNHLAPTSAHLTELSQFERKCLLDLGDSPTAYNFAKSSLLNSINTGADFDKFIDSAPELVVSVRHMSILRDPVIAAPKYGIINLHSGRLPQYQGVMATFWAMFNQEAEIGTTLHYIENASIDTGAVIATSKTHTNYGKSYLWNVLNLYRAGCNNIVSAINVIENGKTVESRAQSGNASYYSYPTQEIIESANFELFSQNDNVKEFSP